MTGRGKHLIFLIYPHCAHALSRWKTPVKSICIDILRYINITYLGAKRKRKTTRLSHDLATRPFACFRFPRRYCQYHPAVAHLGFGLFIDGKDGCRVLQSISYTELHSKAPPAGPAQQSKIKPGGHPACGGADSANAGVYRPQATGGSGTCIKRLAPAEQFLRPIKFADRARPVLSLIMGSPYLSFYIWRPPRTSAATACHEAFRNGP